MDTNLAIQLSEHAFQLLSEQARTAGKTPAELASSLVENAYSGSLPKPIDAATARAEFERCFGSVDLGRPVGLANAAIDADLAREYGSAAGPT
jgi:hypothetical protein